MGQIFTKFVIILAILILIGFYSCDLSKFDKRPSSEDIPNSKKKNDTDITGESVSLPDTNSFMNSIGMKFIYVKPGRFMMGCYDGGHDESPVHNVKITKGFFIQTTEVTQKQWLSIMKKNTSYFKGDNLPVEQVSWDEAKEFINKLSLKEGRKYRLPTEAEWEYTCRSGENIELNDRKDYGEIAWYNANSGRRTHPVAQKAPNDWGLYDMQGNVWEWCEDWYNEEYYSYSESKNLINPNGPISGKKKVIRGGSWFIGSYSCRSTNRDCNDPVSKDNFFPGYTYEDYPANKYGNIGFRIVLSE